MNFIILGTLLALHDLPNLGGVLIAVGAANLGVKFIGLIRRWDTEKSKSK